MDWDSKGIVPPPKWLENVPETTDLEDALFHAQHGVRESLGTGYTYSINPAATLKQKLKNIKRILEKI